jgi:hypothetical protein
MDPLSTPDLFEQFLAQRRYLKNDACDKKRSCWLARGVVSFG